MEKSKTTYWAVYQQKDILFSGTFTQCWNYLTMEFGHMTMAEVVMVGVKIARKA